METFLNFIIFMVMGGIIGGILHGAVAYADRQAGRSDKREPTTAEAGGSKAGKGEQRKE